MTGVRAAGVVVGLIGCFAWAVFDPSASAQMPPATAPSQTRPAEPVKRAEPPKPAKDKEAGPKVRVPVAQNVSLTGRLVDLHSFMTDSYPNQDRAKTTAELIKAGVPAGLDTPAGLIVLGMGTKSPADRLAPLAYQDVEVKGKLWLWRGARYLEITSISKAKAVDTRGTPARPPTVGATPASKPASH